MSQLFAWGELTFFQWVNSSNEYSGLISFRIDWASLIARLVKNSPAMQETLVWFLGLSRRSPGEGKGHLLQYSGLEYSPWGCKESDMTEQLSPSFFHQMTYWKHKAICSWRRLFTFILSLTLLSPLPLVHLSVGFSPPFSLGVYKCLPSAQSPLSSLTFHIHYIYFRLSFWIQFRCHFYWIGFIFSPLQC